MRVEGYIMVGFLERGMEQVCNLLGLDASLQIFRKYSKADIRTYIDMQQ